MDLTLLDLFCGGGGAAKGYNLAGFKVIGIDNKPQPDYPFTFIQADAMTYPLEGFDLIHASPPCQLFTPGGKSWGKPHLDLVTPTLARLKASGKFYVVENVPGAPLDPTVTLCGSMFGLGVRRHRLFQVNWQIDQPRCDHKAQGYVVTVAGHPGGSSNRDGITFGTFGDWQEAMNIYWLPAKTLAQAIPPAYTEYIGRQFLLEDT